MGPVLRALIWFLPALVLLVIIALPLFDEDGKLRRNYDDFDSSLWKARGGILILSLVFLALQIENLIQDSYEPGLRMSQQFYSFSGVSHVVWLQENLANGVVIHFFSLFYLVGLPFLLAFIPTFFLLRGENDLFELYAKAVAVNMVCLIVAYLSFHVWIPAFQSESVLPLMHEIPQYEGIIKLVNRQVNSFPSGHTSLTFTLMLIALYKTELKRLAWFGVAFTVLTVFAITFLGSHWFVDVLGGMAVGSFAYWITSTGKIDPFFEPIMERFDRLTLRWSKERTYRKDKI